MLQWFVENEIALAVLYWKHIIEQNEVEISPEKIAILDKILTCTSFKVL